MELGTGVFLSALFLGLIVLYITTKDRWAWKRIFLRGIGGTVTLVAAIGLGIWGYDQYTGRAVPQDELWGIKLGMSQQEVKYLKGEPTEIDKESGNWKYIDSSDYAPSHGTKFKDGVVTHVWAWKTDKASLPDVAKIGSYADTKEIEEKLGKPTHVSMSKDDLRKMMVYDGYRVWFGLSQEKLQAVGVFDPENYKPGFAE